MFVRSARACSVVAAASFAVAWSVSADAGAQPAGNIDLSGFRPAMDSRGYLTVNASQVLGHKELSFGLGSLDWGYKLLDFESGANDVLDRQHHHRDADRRVRRQGRPARARVRRVACRCAIMNGDRGPDFDGRRRRPERRRRRSRSTARASATSASTSRRGSSRRAARRTSASASIASVFLPTTEPEGSLARRGQGGPADHGHRRQGVRPRRGGCASRSTAASGSARRGRSSRTTPPTRAVSRHRSRTAC